MLKTKEGYGSIVKQEWSIVLAAGSQLGLCLLLSGILLAKGYDIKLSIISILILFFMVVFIFKFYRGYLAKKHWETLFYCWRLQRHDFNNHLQILYTMLQMGKVDKALEYINTVKRQNDLFSTVSSLENPQMISELIDIIFLLKKEGFNIFIDIPEDFDPKEVKWKDIRFFKKKVRDIIKKFEGVTNEKNLQIIFPGTLNSEGSSKGFDVDII
ncbi:MAG: Spo0B domain-containing protein [Thermosediminibacteraceae bacterium]|nr:Spo0B domain-containing protein [Thermosediminibacteraceae bacterium]